MLSVLDIFKIGIGPSSSHTVGPMRAAVRFLADAGLALHDAARVRVVLEGSLALTGRGHGTDRAVKLGLMGFRPEAFEPDRAEAELARLAQQRTIAVPGRVAALAFDPDADIVFRMDKVPALHPNALSFILLAEDGQALFSREYFSVGGGFIATREQLESPAMDDMIAAGRKVARPFGSARELLDWCTRDRLSIAELVLANEDSYRERPATLAGLDGVAAAMLASIDRGLSASGELPGSLRVRRRAPELYGELRDGHSGNEREEIFDWLNAYAMAVNEENAAGGQVVTAPTNGAAGVIPALLRYYCVDDGAPNPTERMRRFLLTAGGIALLYKMRASISGAEMGCQGEVGVACSMGAAGLAAIWGGSPQQVECAAEIGMEHNLGLTCDPVGGLVQIPCIERNAIGAVKAANAARLALRSSGGQKVSLDQVIETMRQTGLDMSRKYKETSQGGLAVNVVEC
ncbi:L-serine ammonia-lyase [Erythrobacter colymbi]|uniref:L-serine ammonia-lyase n=1 Tax=Erythrobacter colymbi TaxID=1161202 RepID=UPI000A3BAD6B|nr:L-serine ammonia-lyase [Erythrobacter colymbi]